MSIEYRKQRCCIKGFCFYTGRTKKTLCKVYRKSKTQLYRVKKWLRLVVIVFVACKKSGFKNWRNVVISQKPCSKRNTTCCFKVHFCIFWERPSACVQFCSNSKTVIYTEVVTSSTAIIKEVYCLYIWSHKEYRACLQRKVNFITSTNCKRAKVKRNRASQDVIK